MLIAGLQFRIGLEMSRFEEDTLRPPVDLRSHRPQEELGRRRKDIEARERGPWPSADMTRMAISFGQKSFSPDNEGLLRLQQEGNRKERATRRVSQTLNAEPRRPSAREVVVTQ